MNCRCDGGAYLTEAENMARSPFITATDCPIHGARRPTGTAVVPFDAYLIPQTSVVGYPYITEPFPCLAVWDIVTPDEDNPMFVFYRDHKCGQPTGHDDSHVCSICGGSWRNRRLW